MIKEDDNNVNIFSIIISEKVGDILFLSDFV